MMRPVDLDALAAVARQLDRFDIPYAFTGGQSRAAPGCERRLAEARWLRYVCRRKVPHV